ncbi:MAG: hypothetical protein QG636_609 [Patescibacteria group bacterium]|nr:hypothetical protein [Patescibacteria group bacterium]
MKRFYLFFLSFALLLPSAVEAQFGPIVPEVCRTCACGFGGVLAIIQNAINFIIGLSIIVATIIIAWAGGLYMLSATNPESRSTANKMLINAAVGLVIVLSAWLIVDFVMKTLYGGQFGPWNSILMGDSGDSCVIAKPTSPLFSGDIFAVPGQGGSDGATTPPLEGADGIFDYQEGISAQARHASQPLNTLLTCMAQRVPANVGQISGISDSRITSGAKTFSQCVVEGNSRQGGTCNHGKNSCHYGGSRCTGSSFAVDFGDEQNTGVLSAAARACGADFVNPEGSHLHVSVGQANGCNCN